MNNTTTPPRGFYSESRLQQECYMHLHNSYPHLRGLFFKIKNEGGSGISAKFITDIIYKILENPALMRKLLTEILEHIKDSGRIHGARDKATGLISGVADSCLLINDTAVFIEFKSEIGRQSPTQKAWQETVEAAGYQYFIIRNLNEFKDLCVKLI